ncbi:hypothetical protein FS749_014117 [Ceratobasidium sp. UAMH 11750]|nr:hypothetical protein FS749_014117 [Ceratobasidium sp. UAMH 11750]
MMTQPPFPPRPHQYPQPRPHIATNTIAHTAATGLISNGRLRITLHETPDHGDEGPHIEGEARSRESSHGGDGADASNESDGGDDSEDEDADIRKINSEAETEHTVDSEDEEDHAVNAGDDAMDIDLGLPDPLEDIHPAPPPFDTTMDEQDVPLEEVVDAYGNKVYIERYPCPTAGEPISIVPIEERAPQAYPDVGQLANPEAFEIGRLLMRPGVTAKFRNCYLWLKRIRGMMPWKNNRELVKDVDKLPHGPDWSVQAMEVEGSKGTEVVEFWGRNVMDIVKGMAANKQLEPHTAWKPVQKWKTPERKERIRDEGYTADFMWRTQEKIKDKKATVVGCIISSDETKLTTFSGDKKAHPVYISLVNHNKALRQQISKRANVLAGYLPVPKLDCEPNTEKRWKLKRQVFHQCMEQLLKPLAEVCKNGGEEVLCVDGGIRRIYPVLAAYVADFPEQCKVACTKTTHCPLCTVKPSKRGDPGGALLRTRDGVIDAIREHRATGSAKFVRLGLWDVAPFWEDHLYVDIGCLLTPDLLHQLHKGVLKDYLTKWVAHIIGKQTMDERHTTMPEYHGMRHFKHGITGVSQWTGRELKEMAKVLLPVASDASPRVVQAVRALLDFAYLAHSSSLSDTELEAMDEALRTFHRLKDVFIVEKAVTTEKAFHGIPKIHMVSHYVQLIRELGTPDGYNTETFERLHIDFAKMGYRASNKVNAVKQMATYIQRLEAIEMHAVYLEETLGREEDDPEAEDRDEWDEWYEEEEAEEDPEEQRDIDVRVELAARIDDFVRRGGEGEVGGRWEVEQPQPQAEEAEEAEDADPEDQHPRFHPVPECVVAKTPMASGTTLADLVRFHGADQIHDALHAFVAREHPDENMRLPLGLKLNVWSRARLFHSPPPFKPSEGPHVDVVCAQPVKVDRFKHVSWPARFDTVMILWDENKRGIHRYRPARIRVIFEFPPRHHRIYVQKLAYVELFNPVGQNPRRGTGLFTTTRSPGEGPRQCRVVPLSSIRMTCHLAPKYNEFEPDTPLTVLSDVLALCRIFYFNIFATYFTYELLRHWSQDGSDV